MSCASRRRDAPGNGRRERNDPSGFEGWARSRANGRKRACALVSHSLCIIEVDACVRRTHFSFFFSGFYDGFVLRRNTKQVRRGASFSHTPCYYTMYGNASAGRQPFLAWRIVFHYFGLFWLLSSGKEERRYTGAGWHEICQTSIRPLGTKCWPWSALQINFSIPFRQKAHAKATRSWKSLESG